MKELSPAELKIQLDGEHPPAVLDVREPWELEVARLDFTIDIPMNQIPATIDTLRDQMDGRTLIVMCHSGIRSARVAQFLQQNGIDPVFNLAGGIQGWSEQVDPSVPTY